MADPELYQQFKGHRDAVTSVHFCPNKKRVVSSSMDSSIMMWNFTTDSKVRQYYITRYCFLTKYLCYAGLPLQRPH